MLFSLTHYLDVGWELFILLLGVDNPSCISINLYALLAYTINVKNSLMYDHWPLEAVLCGSTAKSLPIKVTGGGLEVKEIFFDIF